ncbi:MAG: hypothetical protein V1794_03535 [Candidatus Glassbacteria bacterium]
MKTRILTALFAALFFISSTAAMAAAPGKNAPVLADLYGAQFLRENLIPAADWKPFARYKDRDFWQSLPEEFKKAQVARAEQALGQPWPALPASLFLQYVVNGNRATTNGRISSAGAGWSTWCWPN